MWRDNLAAADTEQVARESRAKLGVDESASRGQPVDFRLRADQRLDGADLRPAAKGTHPGPVASGSLHPLEVHIRGHDPPLDVVLSEPLKMVGLTNTVCVLVVHGNGGAAIHAELVAGVANILDVAKDRALVVVGKHLSHPVEIALELGCRGVPALLKQFGPGR